jgi:hypothetical protein
MEMPCQEKPRVIRDDVGKPALGSEHLKESRDWMEIFSSLRSAEMSLGTAARSGRATDGIRI